MKLTQLEIEFDSGNLVAGQEMMIKGNRLIYINKEENQKDKLTDSQQELYNRLNSEVLDTDLKKDLKVVLRKMLKEI